MSNAKPFVLRIAVQSVTPFKDQYKTEEEITKTYASMQGLMQGAHYWARYYQSSPTDLWRGGYYTNYTLFKTRYNQRLVMHAYQQNATKDYQALAIDLTSIVSRSGLGEDVRGEAYKTASSSKAGK